MIKMFDTTESVAQSTRTSSTPATKVTHTVTSPSGQEFIIFFSAQISVSNVATRAKVDLYVDGSLVATFSPRGANASEILNVFFFHKVTGKTADFDCRIDYSSTDNTNTARIENARIVAWRYDTIQNLDLQYAEANASAGGMTASMAAGATVSFTPPSTGNYIILGAEGFAPGSTSVSVIAQLNAVSTLYPIVNDTTGRWNREAPSAVANAYYSFFVFARQSLVTGASRTLQVEAQNESGTLGNRQYSRILAFREDAFANLYYAEADTATENTNATATYVTRASATASAPASASDFLVLGGIIHRGAIVTPEVELYTAHILVDSVEGITQAFHYKETSSPTDALSMGFAGVYNKSAGFIGKIEHKITTRTDDDSVSKNNFVLIIQEESIGPVQTVDAKAHILAPSEYSDTWQYDAANLTYQTVTAKARLLRHQKYGIASAHYEPTFGDFATAQYPESYAPFTWGISQNETPPAIREFAESPRALHIKSNIGKYYAYYKSITGNNAVGTTFEAELKWVSGDEGDLQMVIQDATKNAWLHIYNGFVKMNGGTAIAVTTTNYHVYRLVQLGNTTYLYIDGVFAQSNTGATTTTSQFCIVGDFGFGGTACEYYIRRMWYSTSGAFAPNTTDSVLHFGTLNMYARGKLQITTAQNLNAKGNIKATETITISAKARIGGGSFQSITAKGRVEKQTTQTITAKGRIGEIGTKTIQAKARIQIFTIKTATAKARIEQNRIKTIIARGRVTISSLRTLDAVGRVEKQSSSTISASASIHRLTTQEIEAKGDILRHFTKNITAKANLFAFGLQIISAKARIKTSVTQEIEAKGAILRHFQTEIEAKARISIQSSQEIESIGNVRAKITRTISAKARMGGGGWQTITAKGSIQKQRGRSITAKGNLRGEKTTSIQTKANIRGTKTVTIEALAQIRTGLEKQISAKARIEIRSTEHISAKANLRGKITRTVTSKGDIVNQVTQTITATAHIGFPGKTISAKANIIGIVTRTIRAKAKIYNPLYTSEIARPTYGVVTMPFPDEATIEPVWMSDDVNTLGGKTRRDVMNRKYRYTLRWNHMDTDDYDALETEINTLVAKTFVYQKWPQSILGVVCLGSLSGRRLEYGVGDTHFLSSVTLTLIEINSRM